MSLTKDRDKLKKSFTDKIRMFVSTAGGKDMHKQVDQLSEYFLAKTMYYLAIGFCLGSIAMFFTYTFMLIVAKKMGLL